MSRNSVNNIYKFSKEAPRNDRDITDHISSVVFVSDTQNYISCALNVDSGDPHVIQFNDSQTSTTHTALLCKQHCFRTGFQHYVFYSGSHCLCGTETTTMEVDHFSSNQSEPCSCGLDTIELLRTGQSLCSKFYISGAKSSLPSVTLAPVRIFSVSENAEFSVTSDISVMSRCWEFGDFSPAHCSNDSDLVHHNFVLAGVYNVTLTLSEELGTYVVAFQVTVESEVRLAELQIPEYADVQTQFPLYVEITSGSNVQTQWTREGPAGVVLGESVKNLPST